MFMTRLNHPARPVQRLAWVLILGMFYSQFRHVLSLATRSARRRLTSTKVSFPFAVNPIMTASTATLV